MARTPSNRIPDPKAIERMKKALDSIDLVAMARRVEWSLYKREMWRRGYRYDEKLGKFVPRRMPRRTMPPAYFLHSSQPLTKRNRMNPRKKTVRIVLPPPSGKIVQRNGKRYQLRGHHYRLAPSATGGVAVVRAEILASV